jgi:hypothetical protein
MSIFLSMVPKIWSYFISKGFIRTKLDSNIYNKQKLNASFQFIIIYVDDYVLVSNSLLNKVEFKAIFLQEFDIVDEGQFHYYISNQIIC